jgi:hypothetical protein
MPAFPRYAVYFAPDPAHPLWRAGCAWLGRDARVGSPLTPAASDHVFAPWRYGFHATLKAPMALKPGAGEEDWLHAVAALALRQHSFEMPRLQVTRLQDFLALCPATPVAADAPLRKMADACVITLDAWRAPLDAAELVRQMRPHYSQRQRAQVLQFGYGQVLDDWRFHMTLSGSLVQVGASEADRLQASAQRCFSQALDARLQCDSLSVFVQRRPAAPFEWTHRFAFAA